MKKQVVFILIAAILMLPVGCVNKTEVGPSVSAPAGQNGDKQEPPAANPVEQVEMGDFAILANGVAVGLRDWDYQLDLKQAFGAPINEEVEELENADTFTGAFRKTIQYDGLKLTLFSPKGNGQTFWIMSIDVLKEGFETSKGIQIGSKVSDIKEAYPEVAIANDGRKDPNNCAYIIQSLEEYNTLYFEVKEGVVKKIRLYHEMP